MNKRILLSSAVIAMLSSNLFAGGSLVLSPNNDCSVADESAKVFKLDSALDLNAKFNVELKDQYHVVYNPAVDLKENTEITFTITNGALAEQGDNKWKLLDDNGDEVGSLTDYTEDDNGDYTDIIIELSSDVNADSNLTLVLGDACDSSYAVVSPKGNTNPLTIAVTKVKSDTGSEKEAPKASAITTLGVVKSILAFKIDDTDGNTIDVNHDRLKFVSGEDGTLEAKSKIEVVTNERDDNGDLKADRAYDLDTHDADTEYAITIKGDMTAISKIKIQDKEFTIDGDTATLTATEEELDIADNSQDIVITVDGETILDPRKFDVSLVVNKVNKDDNNPNVSGDDNHDLGAKKESMEWGINGYQATIRNFINSTVYSSVATVFNENDKDSECVVDLTLNSTGEKIANVKLDDLKVGVRNVITAKALEDKVDADLSSGYTLRITTNIPTSKADCQAWQNYNGTSNGTRNLTVESNRD